MGKPTETSLPCQLEKTDVIATLRKECEMEIAFLGRELEYMRDEEARARLENKIGFFRSTLTDTLEALQRLKLGTTETTKSVVFYDPDTDEMRSCNYC